MRVPNLFNTLENGVHRTDGEEYERNNKSPEETFSPMAKLTHGSRLFFGTFFTK